MRRSILAVVPALLTCVTLAACGGGDPVPAATVPADGTLTIYSSLPLRGGLRPQTLAVQQGIRLALEEHRARAGGRSIRYVPLDDSEPEAAAWTPGQAAANARLAVEDPSTIGYIGDLESGASAVTIPILNAAGIAQISPSNTYVGLTTAEPGSMKGEPDKYYPSGRRTFVRLVPRDTVQGAALVSQIRADGCQRPALVHDDERYGAGLSRIIEDRANAAGVQLVADLSVGSRPEELRAQAAAIAADGADCVLYAG
ncbi:MAG: ABC transporter substrate-binding protein, partial [Actinobacteria bacterium]|nr:ABC transporter substrate-binding protein [Actinomycetota bacterium]